MAKMANKATKVIRDRLDNKDPREFVVRPDLRVFQAKKVPEVPKALRVTRVTPVIRVSRVSLVLLDLRDPQEPKDLLELLDHKDLPALRDRPVSLVKMDPPDPLDLPV